MAEVDKQELYGDFRDAAEKRDKLYMRAAHKALDIPEEMGDINANRTGIGTLGVLGAILLGACGPSAISLWMLMHPTPTAPPATATEQKPAQWEVKWKLGPDGKWQTEAKRVE